MNDLPDVDEDLKDPATTILQLNRPRRRNNEKPLRLNRTLADPDHVERLLNLPALKPKPRAMRSIILANLLDPGIRQSGDCVHYARRSNFYSRPEIRCYAPEVFTYAFMMAAIDSLLEAGVIDDRRQTPSPNAWYRSAIGLHPEFCHPTRIIPLPRPPIILRDRYKQLTPFIQDAITLDIARDVEEQNEFLSTIDISLSDDAVLDRAFAPGFIRTQSGYVNLMAKRYHRVFNERFNRGGRWYAPFWQQLPEALRARILLEGQATAEPDMRTCHPRILCAAAGLDLPFDDPGFDFYQTFPGNRRIIKIATLILVNAANRQQSIRALAQRLHERREANSYAKAQRLIAAIEMQYPGLARFWSSGVGTRLQYLDAEICGRIQCELRREGIPCLSVHDSFIVPTKYHSVTKDLMELVMQETCDQVRKQLIEL